MAQESYQYVKVKKAVQNYHGEKYFRFRFSDESVVQVCVSAGNVMRRGKQNNVGVYTISKLSLLQNYLGVNNVEACQKKEFDTKFDLVVKFLK